MTRVFILAETPEQAQGLADLLAEEPRLEIDGWETAVGDGATGVGWSSETGRMPDVAVLCGEVALSELPFANVPVVVLSGEGREQGLSDWDPRGPVCARLSMESSPQEIVAAISSAAQGLTVLTPEQKEIVFQTSAAVQESAPAGRIGASVEKLTPRELQVLRMVAEGLGNKEIAGQLGISDHTAKFHVASILAKLHAQTRAEAVSLGIRLGLIPI